MLLLSVVYLGMNYSYLMLLSSEGSTKNVFIESKDSSQNFNFEKKSKFLLLKRGTYKIDVSSSDKNTVYSYTSGVFGLNKLRVELEPQKSANFLGESSLKCASQSGSSTVFYSCNPSGEALIESANVQKKGPAKLQDFERYAKEDTGSSVILKPYGDKFIEGKSSNGSFFVNIREANGKTKPLGKKIDNFKGRIADNNFSADSMGKGFAVFDEESDFLYYFSDLNAPAQRIEIKPDKNSQQEVSVLYTKKFVFVLSNNFATSKDSARQDEEAERTTGRYMYSISSNENKIVKTNEISKEWMINSFSEFGEDGAIITLGDRGGNYLLKAAGDLEQANIFPDEISETCQTGNDVLYIRNKTGTSVYKYSASKKASFLVYSTRGGFIENISCANGRLYFTQDNKLDGQVRQKTHFVLGDIERSGESLNSVLPLFFTFGKDTFEIDFGDSGVQVNRIYDNKTATPPSKTDVASEAKKQLAEKGVGLEGLSIKLSY